MKTIKKMIFLLAIVTMVACEDDKGPEQSLDRPLELVATSNQQWTGVAVSNTNRLFANFPNWSSSHSNSVVEVVNGQTLPYPSVEWNTWSAGLNPKEHFICVQSVFIDKNNMLWILDPANIQRDGEYLGVVPGGAKLVKVDLQSNTIVQTISFEEPVIKKTSYLNDVRIDEAKQIGYITDSNEGAIIVVNLQTGSSRRLLSNDASTKSENEIIDVEGTQYRNAQGEFPVIHSDGIGLSPDGQYLYWRALTSRSLFRVQTIYLTDPAKESELSQKIERVGDFPPSDGMIFGNDSKLYLTSIEENAVRRVEEGENNSTLVTKDDNLKWPDSFAVGADGTIYVTASQIHIASPTEPYKIFKFVP